MKWMRLFETMLASVTIFGVCLCTRGLSADGLPPPAPPITDIALLDGGVLVGQVTDAHGVGSGDARVSLQDLRGLEIAVATTDAQGRFAFRGMRAGVYQVVSQQGRGVYRVWMPGTAPPAARPGVLIVNNSEIANGALGDGSLKAILAHPLALGAIAAASVAIPLATNSKSPASP